MGLEDQWVSRYTSRKAVAGIRKQIKQRGYKIVRQWIYFGTLYFAVEYEPHLEWPGRRFKPQIYTHRGEKQRIDWADVYFTYESIGKYLNNRLKDHLFLDHNPGAPIYGPWDRMKHFPVTEISWSKRDYVGIECGLTPKQFADKVKTIVKENKLKIWSAFACHVNSGIGGLVVPKKSWF